MIILLGAGLAGLSTALHLEGRDYLMVERESRVGGLARTVGRNGFLFDFTGHLLHIKSDSIRSLVDDLLGDDQVHLGRSAWIRYGDSIVPYPFQVNTEALPVDLRVECILAFADTLIEGRGVPPGQLLDPRPENRLPLSFLNVRRPEGGYRLSFRDWTIATFGRGFAERFFIPYNEKNFATDLGSLSSDWVSWAIPKPGLEDVLRGALGAVDREYGYNPVFRYPRSGGIGKLPEAMARRIDPVRLRATVTRIDAAAHTAYLEDGSSFQYDALVASNPLPELLRMTTGLSSDVRGAAERLRYTSVAAYNFGIEGVLPHDYHWVYFPERRYPFYRVGFPSHLTSTMAPDGTSSVCAEVAYAPGQYPAGKDDGDAVLAGLVAAGVLPDSPRVLHRSRLDLPFAYVLFDDARREALPVIFRELLRHDIIPVGRYGSWDYLSMETTILQGRETAEYLSTGS